MFVHGVYVYETLNPGSVIAIWASNCKGKWKKLWSGSPVRIGHQPRQFGPPIEPPGRNRYFPERAEVTPGHSLGVLGHIFQVISAKNLKLKI